MTKNRRILLADWLAKGYKLFGKDARLWRFKCSNCGHIQSMNDFIELREKGITDVEPQTAYFSCIGRFDSRLPKVGQIGDNISPCNYTLGGLLCFAHTFVVDEEGKEHPVFEFAPEMDEIEVLEKAKKMYEGSVEKADQVASDLIEKRIEKLRNRCEVGK